MFIHDSLCIVYIFEWLLEISQNYHAIRLIELKLWAIKEGLVFGKKTMVQDWAIKHCCMDGLLISRYSVLSIYSALFLVLKCIKTSNTHHEHPISVTVCVCLAWQCMYPETVVCIIHQGLLINLIPLKTLHLPEFSKQFQELGHQSLITVGRYTATNLRPLGSTSLYHALTTEFVVHHQ